MQGIIAEFIDGSTGYVSTPAQVIQALQIGATLLRPDGTLYLVAPGGPGVAPLLDGYTADQILATPTLSAVVPTADNCAPLFTGGLIRVYFQDSFGNTFTQDFPGALSQFKTLRPDVTVTGCEVFDRQGKAIISQSALDAFAKASAGTLAPSAPPPITQAVAGASRGQAASAGGFGVLVDKGVNSALRAGPAGAQAPDDLDALLECYALTGDIFDPLCQSLSNINNSALFAGLAAEVAGAIAGLANAVNAALQVLGAIITAVAAAVKAVLDAVQKIYEKVLKPIINKIEAITSKIGQILDSILKPYLDMIQRIRQAILNIYGRIFLPIISAIQRIRQALALLRILHVPGVAKLDAALQKIQGKLIGVITQLLNRVNDHSGLFNILLTARMVFQHGVFLNSAYVYQGQMQRLWWDGQTRPLTADEQGAIDKNEARLAAHSNQAALDNFLATGIPAGFPLPGPNEMDLDNLLQGS